MGNVLPGASGVRPLDAHLLQNVCDPTDCVSQCGMGLLKCIGLFLQAFGQRGRIDIRMVERFGDLLGRSTQLIRLLTVELVNVFKSFLQLFERGIQFSSHRFQA